MSRATGMLIRGLRCPQLALHVRRPFESQPSLSGHCGHCPICGSPCPVAIDPGTLSRNQDPNRNIALMLGCKDQAPQLFGFRGNYSITESARSKIDCGTTRPSAFAVLEFSVL